MHLKDKHSFFDSIFSYRSPIRDRRKAACKTPIFTSKKGPVWNALWTGPGHFLHSWCTLRKFVWLFRALASTANSSMSRRRPDYSSYLHPRLECLLYVFFGGGFWLCCCFSPFFLSCNYICVGHSLCHLHRENSTRISENCHMTLKLAGGQSDA